MHAISLDLRKAFDSVSHEATFAALQSCTVPDSTQSLIREIYSNVSTVYWSGGVSDGVRVCFNSGMKQGDPMSPFLFNCAHDPLLEHRNSTELGIHLGMPHASRIPIDDMLLPSNSFQGHHGLRRTAEDYYRNGAAVRTRSWSPPVDAWWPNSWDQPGSRPLTRVSTPS